MLTNCLGIEVEGRRGGFGAPFQPKTIIINNINMYYKIFWRSFFNINIKKWFCFRMRGSEDIIKCNLEALLHEVTSIKNIALF